MARSAFRAMTLQEMMDRVQKAHPDEDVSIIEKAYKFAANAHDGQMRKSGDPYFTHPVFVASILTQIMLDIPTIVAGLLHDTVEDCEHVTLETITEHFGDEVAMLVDGVTKLGRLNFRDREEQQESSVR